MEFLLLIYEDETRFATDFNPAELAEYRAFGDKHSSHIQAGKALQPTQSARTVRVRNGDVLSTDGPFAETKEQLGGFYLVKADSLEEAAAMAAGIPGARFGCIEVRPIMQFE